MRNRYQRERNMHVPQLLSKKQENRSSPVSFYIPRFNYHRLN
jgi:hypothetical protein